MVALPPWAFFLGFGASSCRHKQSDGTSIIQMGRDDKPGDQALFLGPTCAKAMHVPLGQSGGPRRNHVYYMDMMQVAFVDCLRVTEITGRSALKPRNKMPDGSLSEGAD